MMELTKTETQTILLALGVAIDKERIALDRLRLEPRTTDVLNAIDRRTDHVNALGQLRVKLAGR